MFNDIKFKPPDVIIRDGKPTAVILDIKDYEAILEHLENVEDLATLKEMRKKQLEFTPLDDFLVDYYSDV